MYHDHDITLPNNPCRAGELRRFLADHLLEELMPFWVNHAIDPAGGINTMIRDDGTIIRRDKFLWSQWRAVWVFAKLHNSNLGNDFQPTGGWLKLARQVYRFAAAHGWDESVGGWVFKLDGEGHVLEGCSSIYADGFAMYGLAELIRACEQEAEETREMVALARRTADSVLRCLEQPHDQIPHAPYPVPPGARVHGIPMMFSLVFWELGRVLNEPRYLEASAAMSAEVFEQFYRPGRDLVLERIAADGEEYPAPQGTAVVPGHVIEDMWFQIHMAKDRGETQRVEQACRLIQRHLELGWDEQYGGLMLAIDADGRDDAAWEFADTKLWWPHTESLYATLLAYEHTGDPAFLTWYQRIHHYSFAHYPVKQYGGWRQKLDRQGREFSQTVALPVKDPFHTPRALILCLEVLRRLTEV